MDALIVGMLTLDVVLSAKTWREMKSFEIRAERRFARLEARVGLVWPPKHETR